jgi:tRNA threonylcarbamoyl adenosine modification protein (Sua5/YciO/YrdC/YwlC family)
METTIHKTAGGDPTRIAREAGRVLAAGGVVAIPTETVYGLAAAARRPEAVRRLYELKGRDRGKPLLVHLGHLETMVTLAATPNPTVSRLIRRLWPGPLALVVPDLDGGFTGFRYPDHDLACAVLRAAGGVIFATSANASGDADLTAGSDVVSSFSGRVDLIVDAGPTRLGGASTVARVTGRRIEILRAGIIPAEEVRRAGNRRILFVCTGNICRSPMAEGLLRRELARRLSIEGDRLPEHGFEVSSAGTASLTGQPATPEARRVVARLGVDIGSHISSPVTPTGIAEADDIFVASRRHAQTILHYAPEAQRKMRAMLPDGRDLWDPYGAPEEEYAKVAELLGPAVRHIAEELLIEEG